MGPQRTVGPRASDRHERQWHCSRCGEWTWRDKHRCHDCNGRRTECERIEGQRSAPAGSTAAQRKDGACGGEMPQADIRKTRAERRAAQRLEKDGEGGAAGGQLPATLTVGDFVLVGGDKKSRKKAKVLERRLARLEELEAKEIAPAADNANEAVELCPGNEASKLEAELGKKLKLEREDLAVLKGLNERMRNQLCAADGGFEAKLEAKQKAVDNLVDQIRGCKPTPQRLSQAQRHQETLQRKVSADEKRAGELAEMQDKLNKDKEEHAQKSARNAADLAAARQEVGRLAAERAREQGAATAGGVEFSPGTAAWQAASLLVQYVSHPTVRAALLEAGMPPQQEAMAISAAEVMRATAAAATPDIPVEGHRPPGTAEAVAAIVAEGDMEAEVEELEELFRPRQDEQPDQRKQRIKEYAALARLGPQTKFRKHK